MVELIGMYVFIPILYGRHKFQSITIYSKCSNNFRSSIQDIVNYAPLNYL